LAVASTHTEYTCNDSHVTNQLVYDTYGNTMTLDTYCGADADGNAELRGTLSL
jgi:hypothetical protein